jgi:hypothetical protein
MKNANTLKLKVILMALFIITITSSSFTYDNNPSSGSNDPVKLAYTFSNGKSVSYVSTTAVNQAMDINGQTMNLLLNTDLAFSVKMTGKSDQNLKLQITIDSLTSKVESMQGATGGKIKDVAGKSFNMIVTPSGKEIDVTEAEKIEYSVDGTQQSTLSQFFTHIFADLPENPIKIGDTWTKNDTITNKTSTSNTKQIVKSTNKFEGLEQVNGMECAKISSTVTGTLESTVQNNGMDIFITGPVQGTVTIYFAVSNGYLVKQEVLTKMTGTVEITGAQNMSFPITMETSNKVIAGK